ncbi:MAG: type IV toxin-antitoxin system AbiEi family antitoxin domain-containing protein [Acidimicrobiales bacterium]
MTGTSDWSRLATSQHGVISSRQMEEAGISRTQIARLLAGGTMVRPARGLLALAGTQWTWRFRLWQGLLLAGDGAVLSHRSAAALCGLDGVEAGSVDVSVSDNRRPRRVALHRLAGLAAPDRQHCDGFPVTGVGRTLADVGLLLDEDTVERAVECALRRHVVALDELWSRSTSGRPGHRGPARLRAVLERRPAGAAPTESDAETRFVQLVRRCGLEDPVRQHVLLIDGKRIRVDFAWVRIRLAVEVDGAATHAGPEALGRDLRRQNKLVRGWLVQRFTWEDIVLYPDQTAETLLAAWRCAARGWRR